MRILCVSDTVDPLVYSDRIKERFKGVDMVLCAGDLPMHYLGFISSSLNVPLFFVFGNHNLARYDQFKRREIPVNVPSLKGYIIRERPHLLPRTFGSTYIGGKVIRYKSVLIAGMGGSIFYNRGRNQYTQRQMFWKILCLLPRLLWNKIFYGRYIDILLTHSPPYHINDRQDSPHVGFRAFRWFIERFHPQYLLHGHIHLYDINAKRIKNHEQTRVINVYSHYLLEYTREQ